MPSIGRSQKAESAWLLGGPHLGVHVEPRFQRLEVSPVGISEAHVVLLLDRFKSSTCSGLIEPSSRALV
jgi:hypothetical protein